MPPIDKKIRVNGSKFLLTTSAMALIVSASAQAQTIIPNGNMMTTISAVDGEIISNPAGNVVIVDGAPAVEIDNNDVTLNNDGTLATTGVTQTVQVNEGTSGATINNSETGQITADSRAINVDGVNVTINNDGLILGTGSQRNGTVYGNRTSNNITINNSATGVIDAGVEGAGIAIEVGGGGAPITGSITNDGIISGRGQAAASGGTAGDGLRFFGPGLADSYIYAGNITNNGTIQSDSMQGTTAGIRFADKVGFQGTLINNGEIIGAQNGLYFGNADHSGGVVENRGTIASASRAVNIDGIGLTINNTGQILGTGNQRNGTVYADGTADNFTVNNDGLIDAGEGNEGSGFGAEIGGAADGANTFTLVNSGLIQGRGQASAATGGAGDGVRIGNVGNVGLFDGTIINNGAINSESMQGTTAGIRFVNGISFSGTLENNGSIFGVQNGLYFGNAVEGGGGDYTGSLVTNNGSITSNSRALNIDGLGLTIVNNGSITGTGNQRNGTVYADSTAQGFDLTNNGTIDAGEGNEGAGFSAELSAEGNDFTITNNGTIQGRGNAGAGLATAGDGIRLERARVDGALDGTTTGLFTGTITNNEGATIASEGANGTVAGFRVVNGVSFQGVFNNAGTITGVQNGVYFGNPVGAGGADHTGGVFNNLATGVISSDSRAFNIDGIGLTVNNAGDILGTGNQRNGTVYADGTADSFIVNNEGVIDAGEGNEGSGFGAEIGGAADGANTFTLFNTGTIQGRGQASAATGGAGDGVRIGNVGNVGLFDGEIINNGSINSESMQGTTAGIRFVNGISFSGRLENNGSIFGAQNGLYFGNAVEGGGGDYTGSTVTNNGSITSNSRALNIDGLGLNITNNGSITGTGDQRNGTVYADSTAQNFSLTNNGLIDAGMGNLGAGFSAELSAMGNAFSITNNGAINGRGQAGAGLATAGDGLRFERGRVDGVLEGSTTGLFTGSIVNNGSITSESTQGTAAGIRFVNGVSFSGTLENNGLISGVQNGLYFGNPTPAGGGDFTGSLVTNNGSITSGSRALNIDGIGLTVVNNGAITGTGAQRNGTVYADGTANGFSFTNNGLVDATVQGSGVSLQLGTMDGDTRSFTLVNNGTIAGRGEALDSGASAGLRLFNGAGAGTTVTVDSDLTNNGLITSDTGAAVLIENIAFTGTFFNNGTLTGVNAFDASTALNAVNFVQGGGTLGANFIGSAFLDNFTFSENSSELNADILGNVAVTVAAPATVIVNGNRVINGNLNVEGALNFDLSNDTLLVQGDTVLASGSVINVTTSALMVGIVGQSFTFLDETGTFTNNGVTVNVEDDDFLVDYLVEFGSVTVTTAATDLSAVSADANISSFGTALTTAVAANQLPIEIFNALNNQTSVEGFEAAAVSLLPSINEGATREVFETQNVFDSFIAGRLASNETGPGLWGQALARVADRDADSTSISGYDADSLGFSIGADIAAGETFRLGLAYSYAAIDIDGLELTEIDASQISGYFGYNSGTTYINGLVGYSFNSAESSRANLVGTTLSSYDLNGVRAQVNAGYNIDGEKFAFTPFVGLNYANLSTDDFTENGGLNLSVQSSDVSFLEGRIGGRLATKGNDKFGANVNAAYAYDFIGDAREFDLAFAGLGSPFRVSTEDGAQSRLEFGAGVRFGDVDTFSVVLDYQGELASGYSSHSGLIRLRYAF